MKVKLNVDQRNMTGVRNKNYNKNEDKGIGNTTITGNRSDKNSVKLIEHNLHKSFRNCLIFVPFRLKFGSCNFTDTC